MDFIDEQNDLIVGVRCKLNDVLCLSLYFTDEAGA